MTLIVALLVQGSIPCRGLRLFPFFALVTRQLTSFNLRKRFLFSKVTFSFLFFFNLMTSQPYKIAEDKMRARLIKVKISFQFRDTFTPKIILYQRQNYISILITKVINKIRKIPLKQSEFDNHQTLAIFIFSSWFCFYTDS